jgi:hypothetical protein
MCFAVRNWDENSLLSASNGAEIAVILYRYPQDFISSGNLL